tara:strand:+ start:94192 stop:96273 length:2082 start_codon:yes stop_codon:yes gene_type:complete
MPAPSYTTDLTTYDDASTVTNWNEFTGMQTTDGGGGVDPDLAIYGSSCVSESQRKSGLGSIGYHGTGTQPAGWGTGSCFFIWNKFFAPNSLGTLANGGIRVLVGNLRTDNYGWYIDGSDTYPYGGWKNYVIDPTIGSPDMTTGTPDNTWSSVGIGYNLINGISKGNSMTVDIIRWGRGDAIFTGGGPSPTFSYATFNGLAIVNDNATTGRWGLFQDVGGSYLWKGLMSFGTASTAVDFRDSNVVINIDDTTKITSGFNRIEVVNASSRVDWDTILITKLGTQSKGDFEVIDNADVNIDDCFFTSMGTFTFQSNSTINTTTWRLCDQITQGGAVFSECNFVESATSSAVIADNIANISNCSFTSASIINDPISTYYFDESDATATDPNSVWTSDSNAFDGSISTNPLCSTDGSTSSNFLLAEGTNAPVNGGAISLVKARVHNRTPGVPQNSGSVEAAIYTDALGELLGTPNKDGDSPGYGSYATLSTPSGGWTWTKVQALEVKLYRTGGALANDTEPSRVEIEVTSDVIEYGTGHAIEIPNGATGTYIFTGNLFDGYATQSGSTGNEMIYNNSGGLVTINVGSPGDTPTIRNGASASTVVNNNITVTLIGLKDNTEVRVYNAGTQSELAGIESATGGGIDDREFAFSLGAALSVDIVVHNVDYEYLRLDAFTIPGSNSSVPIQQVFDRNYNNPV